MFKLPLESLSGWLVRLEMASGRLAQNNRFRDGAAVKWLADIVIHTQCQTTPPDAGAGIRSDRNNSDWQQPGLLRFPGSEGV